MICIWPLGSTAPSPGHTADLCRASGWVTLPFGLTDSQGHQTDTGFPPPPIGWSHKGCFPVHPDGSCGNGYLYFLFPQGHGLLGRLVGTLLLFLPPSALPNDTKRCSFPLPG